MGKSVPTLYYMAYAKHYCLVTKHVMALLPQVALIYGLWIKIGVRLI